MKNMGKIVLFLIISIIGINHVFAWEEYGIFIDSDNDIEVKVGANVDYTGDISGIYSYEASTNTLTLKENVHYAIIVCRMNEAIAVTSNDSKVYLNMLYASIVTVDRLNSESFMSESGYVWDHYDSDNPDTSMMTHIHVGEMIVKDSTINLKDAKNLYDGIIHSEIEDGYSSSGNIVIQNSTVKTNNYIGTDKNKNLTIKDNSKVKALSLVSLNGNYDPTQRSDELVIKDSKVEVSANQIIYVGGSYNHAIVFYNNIDIDNSDIVTNAMWRPAYITINDSNMYYTDELEKFDIMSIFAGSLTVENSNLDLSGAVIAPDITLVNSNLSCETGPNEKAVETMGYDGSTASALITANMTLTNSNFKAVSLGDVPALIVRNSLTSNKENFVLHNASYDILSLEDVNLEEKGFLVNPNNYSYNYNEEFIENVGVNAKTTLLNGNASNVVISGETVEMTIKVVNGTWEDGTSEDKNVTMILGLIPDKNMFKTKASKQNQELVIERTGDNEYSYIYKDIVNPKTGINNVIYLLISSLVIAFGLFLCRKELSVFKNV